jgi:hypothetical protein
MNGTFIRFDDDFLVIMYKDDNPHGTRVFGPDARVAPSLCPRDVLCLLWSAVPGVPEAQGAMHCHVRLQLACSRGQALLACRARSLFDGWYLSFCPGASVGGVV